MLGPEVRQRLAALLGADDADRARRYPGAASGWQPVHTVYVPADRFGAHTAAEWGRTALATLAEHGPLPGVDPQVQELVHAKLAREPIEDLRIDVEDGYGIRSDDEEDEHVRAAALALAAALAAGSAPRLVGLRMKSLERPSRDRGVRSLDLFLSTLSEQQPVPSGFRVTLPKVTSVAQVRAMVLLCGELERAYRLDRLVFELQVETPQPVLGPDGTSLIAPMLHAAGGRCVGLHYGTYDYSAALGVAAAYQSMEHPAADHAKAVMQVAAAGTGVPVSDGSTNILPVGDRAAVHAGWQLHARLVRRSLERGFYQGWDLHPAQLPTRFAATYGFYRDGFAAAAGRLRTYAGRLDSGILDEPATARALAGFLLRGLSAGVVTADELAEATGLDVAGVQAFSR